MAEISSFCRICAAACGIVVSVEDDRVLKVRGDSDHPISRGYTCSKGRSLPELHHRSDRLDHPRLRGRDVDWSEVLDDLASVIEGSIAASGPDAIALYLATGLAYDSAGQVACGMWMGSVGSSSFYTAATVDNAPVLVAAETIAGHPMLNPVWEPDHARLTIFVGTNPVVSHGYGTTLADPVRRLRENRADGGRIWVIDPRRTETAANADVHLATRPGSDTIVLAALVRSLLEERRCVDALGRSCRSGDVEALVDAVAPFDIESASIAAGIDSASIDRLVEELRINFGRVAMFCGTGTTMSADGILVEWLRWVLLVMTGSLDVLGGMRFNRGVVNRLAPARTGSVPIPGPRSRPELRRVAGQMPVAALVDEIERGAIRVLVVTGGNPLAAFPEPDRFRHAVSLLDALVVIDVAEGEIVDLATHVLPATGQLERADLTLAEQVSFRSGMQFSAAVVEPVAERRPVWWILGSIAARSDRPLFGGTPVEDLSDDLILGGLLGHGPLDAGEVIAAGPHGVDLDVEYGWVRSLMCPEGVWSIAPTEFVERLARHRGPEPGLVMTPRREMAWSNSVRVSGDGGEPVVLLNPEDARANGIGSGAWVAVSSEHGSLVAMADIDDGVRGGVVSIAHGHPGSLTGTLTSSSSDVDPITAMPQMSGVPVRIAPLSL